MKYNRLLGIEAGEQWFKFPFCWRFWFCNWQTFNSVTT